MRYLIVLTLILAACSSKYDDCIDKEKEEYRASHPNASFALINSKQKDFELNCSKYKGK